MYSQALRDLCTLLRSHHEQPQNGDSCRALMPSLEIMCLDPVHLAMVYEYATWHKRTAGSSFLREIMSKLTAHDPDRSPESWGMPFTGIEDRPLNAQETRIKNMIGDRSMPYRRARRVRDHFDTSRPYGTRVEFIEALAALCSLFADEV